MPGFRLTIWTAVLITEIEVIDEAGNVRTITATKVVWMLVSGWMFYFGSLLLNLVYYLMHPSSPEMWTWGATKELEKWTPSEETHRQEEGELK